MLDGLLRLRSGSAHLDLVAHQSGEGGDPAQAVRRHRPRAGGQVAQLDRRVERAHLADQPRSGRACRPWGLSIEKTPTTSSAAACQARGAAVSVGGRQVRGLAQERAARLGGDLRPAGPAGRGDGGDDEALDDGRRGGVTRSRIDGSASRSSASSALSTALPRSMSTTTPPGPSTRSMASLMLTASVPNVVSSRPAATSIFTGRPCSISAASATAARARARLWETTTRPTPCPAAGVSASPAGRQPWVLLFMSTALCARYEVDDESERRLGGRLQQQRHGVSRRGPDARRCVRRGSWPGPCAPASGGRVPAGRAASRATFRPAARGDCSARAPSSASTAGRQRVVHRLVARLGLAAGHDATEPGPQRGGEVCGEAVPTSPSELPIRRKNVPNSGPLAPPTVETNVIPTLVNSAPAVAGGVSSNAATAAFMPRSMFDPWSASPIAASSSVRWSRFSATRGANLRTHSSRTAVVTLSSMGQIPHLSAGVLTGASQSESSSSSTLSRVTDAPAMSSEVM